MRITRTSLRALIKKLARPLAWSMALASLVHPLTTWLARFDWRADLIAHFREPAMASSLVAALVMARIRPTIAIALATLGCWQAWSLSFCYWPNPVPPPAGSSTKLRILSANIHVENQDPDRLIRLIREESPEVVGLIEVSRRWVTALEPIRPVYPYRYEWPADDDGQGLALWFRRPPTSVQVVSPLMPGGIAAIHAVIDFQGKSRSLWLIHFLSPLERPDQVPLGGEFANLAQRIKQEGGGSMVVLGDFNSTDGSPYFQRFLDDSGLRDSRTGFGRQPSWPTWSPYRIAIDHAFLSPDLAVARRWLGPTIGSDHLPMFLDLAEAGSLAMKAPAQVSQSSKPR